MEEIRLLTPEEINQFCNQTINQLNNKSRICLCYALKRYLQSKGIYELFDYNSRGVFDLMGYNKIPQFIPEFTNENAVEYANAEKVYSSALPWWESYSHGFDYDNRILFLEWLKSQYPGNLL